MKIPKLLLGLLIGALIGLLFWYYQKSTSAEDGALDMLDRLAEAEKRAREMAAQLEAEVETAVETVPPAIREDNLKRISGIGPVYEQRLKEAGVRTFADLARQSPERVGDIVGLKAWQAAAPAEWIAAAADLA